MRHKAGGFTLIEILFAIFLVVICAFVITATMPVANSSRLKASDLDKAMGLAQKELEAIRGQGFANIKATQLAASGLIDSATPIAANTYSFTNCDSGNQDNPGNPKVLTQGTGNVKIEQININLVRVTVTVSWFDPKYGGPGGSHIKSYSIGTLIANL